MVTKKQRYEYRVRNLRIWRGDHWLCGYIDAFDERCALKELKSKYEAEFKAKLKESDLIIKPMKSRGKEFRLVIIED